MGKDPLTDEPLMFGSRSAKLNGKNGHSVEIDPFEYPKRGGRGSLVAMGAPQGAKLPVKQGWIAAL